MNFVITCYICIYKSVSVSVSVFVQESVRIPLSDSIFTASTDMDTTPSSPSQRK